MEGRNGIGDHVQHGIVSRPGKGIKSGAPDHRYHAGHEENCEGPFHMVFILPSRQGLMGRERPSQGVLRKCEWRNTPAPAPGSKKGGSLPSTSIFPVRPPGGRKWGRN